MTVGRFYYGTLPASDAPAEVAAYGWQCRQDNYDLGPELAALRSAGATAVMVYADATVYNPAETTGVRVGLAPTAMNPAWLLTPTRAQNHGETLVDVGNPEYQAASAAFLVAKCQTHGYDGVVLDELNEQFSWGGWSAAPSKYPSDAAWQAAQLSYLTTVSAAIRAAGFSVYANYGGSYETFAEDCLEQVTGLVSQYWVGKTGTTAPLDWAADLEWASYCEGLGKQSVYHISTASPQVANFGLCTFLLVTEGHGVVCAAVSDSGDDLPLASLSGLGAPSGPFTLSGSTYTRQFANGRVVADSAAQTGTIYLGGTS